MKRRSPAPRDRAGRAGHAGRIGPGDWYSSINTSSSSLYLVTSLLCPFLL
ncbi:MAG: hypothetical protein GX999_06800 [Bacteroidales bacterium]|nr:hypothetical protein [Bacteroidales bacterium]